MRFRGDPELLHHRWILDTVDADCGTALVATPLNDFLDVGGTLQSPAELQGRLSVTKKLQNAAEVTTRKYKAPVKLLGVYTGTGDPHAAPMEDFELSEAEWPHLDGKAGWASQREVWVEWQHVQQQSASGLHPHRVSVRVDNVIYDVHRKSAAEEGQHDDGEA